MGSSLTSTGLDCQRCGACCAHFRVSFYWAEAEAWGLPSALVHPLPPLHACMAGTANKPRRCVALAGELGQQVACTVYAQRPSPCREVQPGDAQCLKARAAHGMPVPQSEAQTSASAVD